MENNQQQPTFEKHRDKKKSKFEAGTFNLL